MKNQVENYKMESCIKINEALSNEVIEMIYWKAIGVLDFAYKENKTNNDDLAEMLLDLNTVCENRKELIKG